MIYSLEIMRNISAQQSLDNGLYNFDAKNWSILEDPLNQKNSSEFSGR